MKYYVWIDNNDESYAWIKDFPDEIRDCKWKLKEGVSCADWFPENTVLPIYSEDGIKLTDSIQNYSDLLIISEKLKAIFEKHSGANFEYLPVRISDKKGRVTPNQYYIANLLDTVDCLDMEKSSYVMGSIIKDQVSRFSELILDENNIDPTKKIFRLKDKTDQIVVSEEIIPPMKENGIKGPALEPVEDYGLVFRD